jgi:Tol biopolymer transport system component/predicted Ser/Thr protein kinase
MPLPTADWPRVRQIFADALTRPPVERAAYVAAACGGDAAIHTEVEKLLASHDRAEGFLDSPAVALLPEEQTTHLEGKRIGPYQLSSRIGAGGMGEVYKARDTRLDRTVAIKVLPAHVAHDPQARERFDREARAVAALNHPHICTLYDVGHQDGVDFLVMEFVEGESLASRLERGSLPIAQALDYAVQIASALDRAHRAGIVHRDLKPGNIMLTKAGAKLLDFGLAKWCPPAIAGAAPLAAVSASELTTPGTIIGTVQYMAPEQLENNEIDARTDLFAFGAVVFEMVTGEKAFTGESPASLIGAILNTEPPAVSARQALAPPALDRIVSTCLAKDPDDRWQTARDLLRELRWTVDRDTAAEAPVSGQSRLLVGVLLAVAVTAVAIAVAAWRTDDAVAVPDVRFSVYPERGSAFVTAPASVVTAQFALSPDSSHLAYVATANGRPMLWVRALNGLTSRVLAGTEDAAFPCWSADSREVAFFAGGNKLRSVALSGGSPRTRADASIDSRGCTWGADGRIVASLVSLGGLSVIDKDESVRPAIEIDRAHGESSHRWPSLLPDGRHFLFVLRGAEISQRGIYLAALGDETKTRLVEGSAGAAVVADRLFFVRGGTLMAQVLDIRERRLLGDAVALLDRLGTTSTGFSGFSVSRSGTLAYTAPWPTRGDLVWLTRDGRRVGAPVTPTGDYVDFALSPDGARVAISQVDPQTNNPDIWLFDFARGSMTRLTSDHEMDASPCWSPDSARITFRSNRRGFTGLWTKAASGSRSEEPLFEGVGGVEPGNVASTDCARDGTRIVFSTSGLPASFDIWHLALTSSARAMPIRQTPFNEYHEALSPDGKWLAYVSDETGLPQVYVQSFPEGAQRAQISSQGGTEPRWRRDGQELYFLSANHMLMAVRVSATPTLSAGLAVPLFRAQVPLNANPYRRQYVPAPDGQRFLVNTVADNLPPPAIHVVLDWRALLPGNQK